jgi:anti-anti-sigma factor
LAARLPLRGATTRCNVMDAENLSWSGTGLGRTLLNPRSIGSEPSQFGDRPHDWITMAHRALTSSAPPLLAAFTVLTPGNRRLARLDTQWVNSPVAVICARGEIDQANAHTLAEYSLAYLAHRCGLILDLTGLEFFGAAGFSALHRVSVSCAHAGIDWALVPGSAVSRLLRICDPDGLLPSADSVGAALATLQGRAADADHRAQTTSKCDAVSN